MIILSLKKDKVQNIGNNQLKLEVHDTYKKDEEITTNFKPTNSECALNKAYLDEKIFKTDGNLSFSEKDYKEFKILCNEQTIEEVFGQRVVKKTIQKLYDECLFDAFPIADKVLEYISFATRHRPDL